MGCWTAACRPAAAVCGRSASLACTTAAPPSRPRAGARSTGRPSGMHTKDNRPPARPHKARDGPGRSGARTPVPAALHRSVCGAGPPDEAVPLHKNGRAVHLHSARGAERCNRRLLPCGRAHIGRIRCPAQKREPPRPERSAPPVQGTPHAPAQRIHGPERAPAALGALPVGPAAAVRRAHFQGNAPPARQARTGCARYCPARR
mgnify:CR=1 FL=1